MNRAMAVLVWAFFVLAPCVSSGRSDKRPATAGDAPAAAQSVNQIVDGVDARYRGLRTLRAGFTQTYTWSGAPRVETGSASFARGGLMRWTYTDPQDKLVVSDGKTLWLYVPEDKQVTRSSVKSSEDPRVPFPFLLERFDLHKVFSKIQFDDQALKAEPGDRVLRGSPRRGLREVYSEVLMEVTPQFDIRRLVVFYPDHSVMEFKFDHWERNVMLSPSLFRFAPPPGSEVIDERQ
jgi:outer membrane lipoprotein carrier protein